MAFCTEIVCDGCGECISRTKICSKERMTRIARSDGWSVGKDIQLCSDCRKNKKQLKKEGWI